MKKFALPTLLAGIIILASNYAFSQTKARLPENQTKCWIGKNYIQYSETGKGTTSIFAEDFSSGTFPPAGWAINGSGAGNWSAQSSTIAGGAPPEAMFFWSPQFVGNSKLVTPMITTSGMTELMLEFKHMLFHYDEGYAVLVETSSDGITWSEVWSIVNPSGSVGPETAYVIIANDDVGSDNFQLAFTFSGDSYNINGWFLDDIVLSEALSYDALPSKVIIPSLVSAGDNIIPGAIVKNNGSQTITFNVTFEILQSLVPVYTATQTVNNLQSFESSTLVFDPWTATAGNYIARVTSSLAGDENPSNDTLTKNVSVVAESVAKKPMFEEFTSSTCGPCAAANPIIDAVLAANPGEYSLVKYQMNWPGGGDLYYTEQGGVRRDYYSVIGVPSLFGNGLVTETSDFSQEIFDAFAGQISAITIDLTTSIDENYIVNVSATINSMINYAGGLKALIVVVEKTTVGNVGVNGETEFRNVMMTMLPDAVGTTLGALSPGVPVTISESYDMHETFMEQPNDLAVIVLIQDDTDKSILQSEMQDIDGSFFPSFNVTFNVEDSFGNAIEGAEIFLEGNGFDTTNAEGQAVYTGVFANSYNYQVNKLGLLPTSGSFNVVDQNVTVDIVLEIPDYYFYEDFGLEPTGWSYIFSGTNVSLWWDGVIVLCRYEPSGDIMLITPQIDLSQGETLFVEVGNSVGDPSPNLLVGTVADPSDPASFNLLATLTPPVNGFEDFPVDLTAYPGTDSYLAFKFEGPVFGYFYITSVKITRDYTGVEELPVTSSLSVFPNPTKNIVNLKSETEIKMIKIYNYAGQLIKVAEGSGKECQIITSDFTPGIYLLMIEMENETTTQKIVIE